MIKSQNGSTFDTSSEQSDSEPRDSVDGGPRSRSRIMDGGDRRRMKLGSQKIKWFSFNVDYTSNMAAPRPSSSQGCLGVRGQGRRPSFLYRSESPEDLKEFRSRLEEENDDDASINVPHIAQKQKQRNNHNDSGGMDEQIVTPFARILHKLHNIRTKYAQYIGVQNNKDGTNHRSRNDSGNSSTEGEARKGKSRASRSPEENGQNPRGKEILEELDWCLEHLENLQTHKSVADLASSKFKRILNKELNHLAESGKGGSQVKEYLSHTFLDSNDEENDAVSPLPSDKNTARISQRNGNDRGSQAAPMSEIAVGAKGTRSGSFQVGDVPKYGVEGIRNDSLDPLMTNLDVWGIDIFKIDRITNGHTLTAVAFTIVKERDLLNKFSIAENEFVNYMRLIESHYYPPSEVPYHGQLHAADVTQGVHSLLSLPSLQGVFTEMEQLVIVIAAAIHDVDHPGLTNQYLINTGSELALMYNDESVLESHSLAVAFKLLQQADCNILRNFTTKSHHRIRKMIIDLVISTDMSKHMGVMAELKTMVETRKQCDGSIQQTLKDDYSCRLQVLQSMIHGADLSNPTKPLHLYREWTDRIMQEFFKQGDIERELKLDISPMCDRYTATVEKNQIGFIDYIVQPQWETWAELVYPDCSDILDTLEDNRQWYQARLDSLSGSTPTTPSTASSISPEEKKPAETASKDQKSTEKLKSNSAEKPNAIVEKKMAAKSKSSSVAT